MDARVTALEIHMEYVRSDLAELKAGQKEMAKALAELSQELSAVNFALKALPTKNDLWAWKMQWWRSLWWGSRPSSAGSSAGWTG